MKEKFKKTELNHATHLETNELIVKENNLPENQFGVFAKKDFKKDEQLFLVKGPIVPKPSIYSLSADLNEHIEPIKENGDFDFGHYFNHSCNPNTIVTISREQNSIPYIKVTARKDIKKGEELTFDYATLEYVTVTNSICKCNSENCRGVICGFRDLPEDVAKKYQQEGMIAQYLLDIKPDLK
jgi:SET domain-containing protein